MALGSFVRPLAAIALLGVSQPGAAQSLDDLDRLVQASQNAEAGIGTARFQADSGALLEALATLERVLAIKPDAKQARLLHASLLCRIDDLGGASVEFTRLRSRDFKKAEWTSARAPCEALAADAAKSGAK